jgi:hypothetical protein
MNSAQRLASSCPSYPSPRPETDPLERDLTTYFFFGPAFSRSRAVFPLPASVTISTAHVDILKHTSVGGGLLGLPLFSPASPGAKHQILQEIRLTVGLLNVLTVWNKLHDTRGVGMNAADNIAGGNTNNSQARTGIHFG